MLTTVVVTIHVIVAFVMIVVVLLQSGKGASIGSSFGGSSQTVFGSRGPASFLSKFTTASAVIFMVTSLMLSVMSTKVGRSSIADQIQPKPAAAPASTAVDPFKAVHEAQTSGIPAPAQTPVGSAPGQDPAASGKQEQKGPQATTDKKP